MNFIKRTLVLCIGAVLYVTVSFGSQDDGIPEPELVLQTIAELADITRASSPAKEKQLLKELKKVAQETKKGAQLLSEGRTKHANKKFVHAHSKIEAYQRRFNSKPGKYGYPREQAQPLLDRAKVIGEMLVSLYSQSPWNFKPVADAGPDQGIRLGQRIVLDGSGSSDVDGDALRYRWQIASRPAGSAAYLDDQDAVFPVVSVDLTGQYTFQLLVSDDYQPSLPDSVTVNAGASNTLPVAHAGPDQSVVVGDRVILDGSASSDIDGDALNYRWSLLEQPSGSDLVLENTASIAAIFTPELAGQYIANLVVNDGFGDSETDSVTVQVGVGNTPPVANAGMDKNAFVGGVLVLSGAGSSDVDGDTLSYAWSLISQPSGSTASLNDPGLVQVEFTLDTPGQYIAQLVVNDGLAISSPDTVVVNTLNSKPVADAGLDQSAHIGDTLQLDGTGSVDIDGDALGYVWSLIAKPEQSGASLSNTQSASPELQVDRSGQYVAQLLVNDGVLDSNPDTVNITTQNTRPVADAGSDQIVTAGDRVGLNASLSSDADGDSLSYQWAMTSRPGDSQAAISDASRASPSYATDEIGFYVSQLIVSDGDLDSAPSSVTTKAEPSTILEVYIDSPAQNSATTRSPIDVQGHLSHKASLLVDGQATAVNPDLSFSYSTALSEGGNTIIFDAANALGETSSTELQLVLDTSAPDIVLDSPLPNTVTNIENLTISGHLSEPGRLSINGDPVSLVSGQGFSVNKVLLEGLNEFFLSAVDLLGNRRDTNFTVELDTHSPADLDLSLITFEVLPPDYIRIRGRVGSAESGSIVVATNQTTGESISVVVEPDGSFILEIKAQSSDMISITSQDRAGNQSTGNVHLTNVAPEFLPLPDQIALVGHAYSLQLSASDVNQDVLRYSASSLPGNAQIDAQTGVLSFTPTAEDIGEYSLTLFVSDGIESVAQTATLTVPLPDANTVTSFSGRLLDAQSAAAGISVPIEGVIVSFLNTAHSAVTDTDGRFTIGNAPTGAAVLDLDSHLAQPGPGNAHYSNFRKPIEIEANVANTLNRPIYLPRIDQSSVTMVDPETTTMVENPGLGIVLEVAPHTAKNPDGTDFTGELSISEVPDGLTPVQMPDFMQPGLLITIQPTGVVFTEPAPIRFPNYDHLTMGSEVDLWSLDPDTGHFYVVGTGRVSASGDYIETISGGVHAADWHAILPPAAPGSDEGYTGNCGCGDKTETSSDVYTRSGWLSTDFSLPNYRSQGESRGLQFVYRTESAYPTPIVPFDVTIPVRSAIPPTVSYQAEIGGISNLGETFIGTTGLLENQDEILRAAVQLDGTSLPTGLYPYRVQISSNFDQSSISSYLDGEVAILNTVNSPLGAGWGLGGLSRLIQNDDGSILITNANGARNIFRPGVLAGLNKWEAAGNETSLDWQVSSDQRSVIQTSNGIPGLFVSPDDVFDTTIRGRLRVEYRYDDDFIGFVLGLKSPLIASDPDILNGVLFDWKKAYQTSAREGFTLFRANNVAFTGDSLWGHGGANGVVLGRDDHPGSGWRNNYDHYFEAQYAADKIVIRVDGREVFNQPGTFSPGRFAFYNYSQPSAHYEVFSAGMSDVAVDGQVMAISAPTSVSTSGFQRNGFAALFMEKRNIVLSQNIPVDITAPGTYIDGQNLSPGTINAGKRVNSFYLSVDTTTSQATAMSGSMHFEDEILGVVGTALIDQSDALLGRGATTYPKGSASLETNGSVTISADRHTLSFSFWVDPSDLDPLRIITRGSPEMSSIYVSEVGDYSKLSRNANGAFTKVAKDGTLVRYNIRGLQTQNIDRNGNATQYEYDTQERLIRVTDPVGLVTTLNYAGGKLANASDPANRITTFGYDARGNMTQVIFPDGSSRQFAYDVRHLMTMETDERGLSAYRVFDFAGRLVQSTRADGSINKMSNEHSVGLIDLASGRGTRAIPAPPIRPASAESYFEDDNGHRTLRETDGFGRLIRETDANGLTTLNQRDIDGNATRTTRPDGSSIDRTYDPDGNLLQSAEGFNNAISTQTYEPTFNQLTSRTDPRGNLTRIEYDAQGNAIKQIDALGYIVALSYTPEGLLERSTDPNDLTTQYTYDASGRMQSKTETPPPGGGTTRITHYQYDTAGQLTHITQPDGIIVDMNYDPRGRLLSTQDNLGQHIDYRYDVAGNLINTDTRNADSILVTRVAQAFDEMNRRTELRVPHDEAVDAISRLAYDGAGNTVSQRDPKLQSAFNQYDPGDRLIQQIDRDNGYTHYAYDALGNIVSVTAPNGAQTTYAYDALSRRTRETSPDRGQLDYTYDLSNNLTSVTDARGITVSYQYDALNRITDIQYPDATEDVQFVYDSCSYGIGRVCSRTDESGSYAFGYDAYGNLTEQQYTMGSQTFTTAYEYDAGHQLSKMTHPDGRVITYTRDALRRLQGIQMDGVDLLSNIRYRADGAVTARQYGNGLVDTRHYDGQGRLLGYELGQPASSNPANAAGYRYDENSNVLDRNTTSDTHAYGYDTLDRIIQEYNNALQTDYTYDANHNRLSETEGAQSRQYDYGPSSNQLIDLDGQAQQYDAAGHLLDDGQGRQYAYNDAGRMESVEQSGAEIAHYVYNAKGQRKIKTVNGQTTVYHYDLQGNLIEETMPGVTNTNKDYAWQNSMPVAQVEADNSLTYLHPDHLATARLGTDTTGTITWKWEGKAFGESPPLEDPDGDGILTTISLRFPRQYYDQESGLFYNWNRYYDPATGRYIIPDPIGLDGGINAFGYVDGNPANGIDPTGLIKLYGEWCGPDWTGGYRKPYNQLDNVERSAAYPPVDNLDRCCQSHDITYSDCREKYPCDQKARAQCMKDADRALSNCASNSGGGQSPMALLFGNPQDRIENYMRDSKPDGGEDPESCTCGQ